MESYIIELIAILNDEKARAQYNKLISDLKGEDIEIGVSLEGSEEKVKSMGKTLLDLGKTGKGLSDIKINMTGNAPRKTAEIANNISKGNNSILGQIGVLGNYKDKYQDMIEQISENGTNLGQGFINGLHDLNTNAIGTLSDVQKNISLAMSLIREELDKNPDNKPLENLFKSLQDVNNKTDLNKAKVQLETFNKEVLSTVTNGRELSDRVGGLNNLNLKSIVSELDNVIKLSETASAPVVKELVVKTTTDAKAMADMQSNINKLNDKMLKTSNSEAMATLTKERNKLQAELTNKISESSEQARLAYSKSMSTMENDTLRVSEAQGKISQSLSKANEVMNKLVKIGKQLDFVLPLAEAMNDVNDFKIDSGNISEAVDKVGRLNTALNTVKQNSQFDLAIRVADKGTHVDKLLTNIKKMSENVGLSTGYLDKYSDAIKNIPTKELATQEMLYDRLTKKLNTIVRETPFEDLEDGAYATSQRIGQLDTQVTSLLGKMANTTYPTAMLGIEKQLNDVMNERKILADSLVDINGKLYSTDKEKKQVENREKMLNKSYESMNKRASNAQKEINKILSTPNIDKDKVSTELGKVLKAGDFKLEGLDVTEASKSMAKHNQLIETAVNNARKLQTEQLMANKALEDSVKKSDLQNKYDKLTNEVINFKTKMEQAGASTKELDDVLNKLKNVNIDSTDSIGKTNSELKMLSNTFDTIKRNANLGDIFSSLDKGKGLLDNVSVIKNMIPQSTTEEAKALNKQMKGLNKELDKTVEGMNEVQRAEFTKYKDQETKKLADSMRKQYNIITENSNKVMKKASDSFKINNIDKAAVLKTSETLAKKNKNLELAMKINADTGEFYNEMQKVSSYAKDKDLSLQVHIDSALLKSDVFEQMKSLKSTKIDFEYAGMDTSMLDSAIDILDKSSRTGVKSTKEVAENFKALLPTITEINKSAPKNLFSQITDDMNKMAKLKADNVLDIPINIKMANDNEIKKINDKIISNIGNLNKSEQSKIKITDGMIDVSKVKVLEDTYKKTATNISKEFEKVGSKINEAFLKGIIDSDLEGKLSSMLRAGSTFLGDNINDKGINASKSTIKQISEVLYEANTKWEKLQKNSNLQLQLEVNTNNMENALNNLEIQFMKNGYDTSYLDVYKQSVKDILNSSDTLENKNKQLAQSFKDLTNETKQMKGLNPNEGLIKTYENIKKSQEAINKEMLKIPEGSARFKELEQQTKNNEKAQLRLRRAIKDVNQETLLNNIDKSSQSVNDKNALAEISNIEKAFEKAKKAVSNFKLKSPDIGEWVRVEGVLQDVGNGIEKIKKQGSFINPKDVAKLSSSLGNVTKSIEDGIKKSNIASSIESEVKRAEGRIKALEIECKIKGDSLSEVERLKKELTNAKATMKVDVEFGGKSIDSIHKQLDSLNVGSQGLNSIKAYEQALNSLAKEQKSLMQMKVGDPGYAEQSNKVRNLQNAVSQLNSELKQAGNIHVDSLNKAFEAKNAQNFAKEVDKVGNSIKKMQSHLSDMRSGDLFNGLISDTTQLDSAMNKVESEISNLKSALNGLDFNNAGAVDDFNRIKASIEQCEQGLRQLDNISIELSCETAIKNLEKLKNDARTTAKQVEEINDQINKVNSIRESNKQDTLNGISDNTGQHIKDLKSVDKYVNKTNDSISKVGKNNGFKKFFSDVKSSISTFTPGYLVGQMLENSIRTSARYIKDTVMEVDSAMTDVLKVADNADVNTSQKVNQIRQNAVQITKEVGGKVSDSLSAISIALNQGAKDMDTANLVARYSQILSNVGDIDTEQSTKSVAVLMNAFKLDPLKTFVDTTGKAHEGTNELAASIDMLNYAG